MILPHWGCTGLCQIQTGHVTDRLWREMRKFNWVQGGCGAFALIRQVLSGHPSGCLGWVV